MGEQRHSTIHTTEHSFSDERVNTHAPTEHHTWGLPMPVRRSPVNPPPVNPHRDTPAASGRRNRRWPWSLPGWLMVASLWQSGSIVQAQEPPPAPATESTNSEYTLPVEDASGSASFRGLSFPRINYPLYPNEPPVVGGFGAKGRIGGQAGTTVGQSQPITNFDLSPYVFQDNLYLFGEGRIALGNDGKTGGSIGAGGRYFFPQINSILGASGWVDIDATRGPTFHQWGINAEFLSEFLDIRGNIYVPYGSITQVTGQRLEAGSQQFSDRPLDEVLPGEAQGTYLSFQRRIFSATALQGFDTLFSIPVPGEFAQTLNLEASAGFYGYEAKDGSVPQTYGWRARFDIDLFERLSHMFLEVNQDKAFKTNVAFGADINYWHKLEHRPRLGHSQYNRLAEWVRRNRTTVALEGSALGAPELAINPATNRPYVVYQVLQTDESSHGGDGTLANPFQNLQDAINATGTSDPLRPSDFVDYVHGNSVIQDGIMIGPDLDGLQVIGEQTDPTAGVVVSGLGTITLPNVTPQPFNAPTIQNVLGSNAVTINSNNTQFSAFDIFNITGGDAISFSSGVNGALVQNVNITTVNTGNGITLNNDSGNFNFNNVVITDIEGDALRIQGGNAAVSFSGVSQIDNSANSHAAHGYAVNILDAAGSVQMSSMIINDTGGQGIRIYGTTPGSSTSRVTFGKTTLTDTVVTAPTGTELATGAVYIRNHNASVFFSDDLTINGIDSVLGGNSFAVEALQASGSVFTQGTVSITGRRGHGIYVVDSADSGTIGQGNNNVNFQGAVSVSGMGSGYAGSDSAVLFQSYSGGLIFANGLTVNGSRGDGVEITAGTTGTAQGTNTGLFNASNVRISNVSGSGGVTGTSFNVHDIDKQAFQVNTNGITITNRGIIGSTGLFGAGIRIFNYEGQGLFGGTTLVNNELASEAIGIDVETNSSNATIGFGTTTVNDQIGFGSYGVRVLNNLNTQQGIGFNSLSVSSLAATAVSLQDNSNVTISSGVLDAVGARAIEVFTSAGVTPLQTHSINLTTVNASGADYGIYVDRSTGDFTVSGDSGVGGTGGLITGMSIAGAHFQNTQIADLNFMRFTSNKRGVEGISMVPLTGVPSTPYLRINESTISSSASEGIYAQDVSNVNLQSTVVQSNGVTDTEEQIEIFSATDIGIVNVIFNNNNITDSLTAPIGGGSGGSIGTGGGGGGGDMIYIHNAPGLPTTSALNLTFTNNGSPGSTSNLNSITSNRTSGNAAINITWTGGATDARFDTNQINLLSSSGQIGLNLATDGPTTISYTNNGLNAAGNNDIGIQGVFQQSTTFNVSGNQAFDDNGTLISGSGFLMSGSFATGMNLQFLATGNQIVVNNNLFQFTQLGSEGMVFQRLTGNGDTNLAIGNNSIYRPLPGNTITTPPTVGIYIQSVLGNVNLINSGDNFVQYGSFPFQSYYDFLMTSPNAANGSTISVNGILYP